MQRVNFLDLSPKRHTETAKLAGEQEVELTGLSFTELAEIAKRFPALGKVLDGDVRSLMENPEAVPALVAAGLGLCGDAEQEAKVAALPLRDVMRMGWAVVRATFPDEGDDPLPEPVVGNGADVAPAPTSPLQLNS